MNTLNSGTRIGTMILDHVMMTFVTMVFVAPGMVYDIIQTFGQPNPHPKLFLGNYYMNIFAFSLYFNKDMYLGRSPAKRILKLQVIDLKTNRPAGPLQCLVRNLTIIVWPIEVVVALINNERRIGDFIAGTKLTVYDPEMHQENPNWALILGALLLSMIITYLVMFLPIELLLSGFNKN